MVRLALSGLIATWLLALVRLAGSRWTPQRARVATRSLPRRNA
jgi:hypothetical protein